MKTKILAAIFAATLLTGCATSGTETMRSDSDETPEAVDADLGEEGDAYEEADAEPEKQNVRKRNIALKLRETGKQCFGSAGCNLEYKVVPELVGLSADAGFADDFDITYEVRGGTDGPIVETFVLYEDGTYDVPYEGFASTPSNNTKLKAVVTSVIPVNG